MIGAILVQLVGRSGIPIYLRKAFQESQKEIGGRGLLLAELMRMLRTTISSLRQVFICIDALDDFRPGEKGEINAKIEEENPNKGKKRKNKRIK